MSAGLVASLVSPDMTADSFARLASVVRPGWVPVHPEEPDDDRESAELGTGPAHRLPARRMPRRVGLSAMAAAAAVVVALVGRGVLSDAGAADTVPAVPLRSAGVERSAAQGQPGGGLSRAAGPAASASTSGSASARAPMAVATGPTVTGPGVVVHVVGRVRRPGLVTLAAGARVADAVAAAGGVTSGAALQRINLARFLADGEQLMVPGAGDPLPAEGGAGTGTAAGSGAGGAGPAQPVDLNTATEAQLDELPGVGPVTAARIIAWRREHQRFTRVEELGEVDGIGAKMLERLRPLVRV